MKSTKVTKVLWQERERDTELQEFLTSLKLSHLIGLFESEAIDIDILREINSEELKELGVDKYGERFKITRGITKWDQISHDPENSST